MGLPIETLEPYLGPLGPLECIKIMNYSVTNKAKILLKFYYLVGIRKLHNEIYYLVGTCYLRVT